MVVINGSNGVGPHGALAGRKAKHKPLVRVAAFLLVLSVAAWLRFRSSSDIRDTEGRHNLSGFFPAETLEVKRVPVTSGKRLLFPQSRFGLSNQMACLNLAGILAIQYNRTLEIPEDGCAANRKHDMFPIPMQRVYNLEKASERIAFHTDEFGARAGKQGFSATDHHLPPYCQSKVQFSTKHTRNEDLAKDPYPEEDCIALICHWTRIRFVAPPDLFPHVDNVIFPYNDVYKKAAKKVVAAMRRKVLGEKSSKKEFRFLGMTIRRGDRTTVPLLNCSDTDGLYPHIFIQGGQKSGFPVQCTNEEAKDEKDAESKALTWEAFLKHISSKHCKHNKKKRFPVCASDFNAIFIATNDPDWVRDQIEKAKLSNVFLIGDFPEIRDFLLNETLELERIEVSAEMLLVEESVLVQSNAFVPSFPSSITQQILRLRLDNNYNVEDKHRLDTYYEFRAKLHHVRWPTKLGVHRYNFDLID